MCVCIYECSVLVCACVHLFIVMTCLARNGVAVDLRDEETASRLLPSCLCVAVASDFWKREEIVS